MAKVRHVSEQHEHRHVWVRSPEGDTCECGTSWREAHQGFSSKHQPLSGNIRRRVPRK